MSNDFWRNRIIESGSASPEELAKGMNPFNWRGHPESQREALEEALDSIGFLQRVLVNRSSGRIIDGHLRIELAVLKQQPLIPVDYVELTDDEEALALATLDAITEQAQPIADKLAALMERTKHLTADKPGLAAMLEQLKIRAGVNGNGHTPPEDIVPIDKAEELQKKWQVKAGDVWQIADHFIICGDCREPETWQRLLSVAGAERVNGVFTSPPYAEQRKAQYGGVPTAEYVQWWEAVQANVREWLAGDGSFFVNIKPHCEDGQRVLYVFDLVLAMVREWGWRFVDELCWTFISPPGKWPNRFKNGFEPVYQFSGLNEIKFNPWQVSKESNEAILSSNGGGLQAYYDPTNKNEKALVGGRGFALPTNVVNANLGEVNIGTLNQTATFPIALPTFFLKAYSDPGDVWLDPFCGSGTVLAACHNENRQGLGIEQLPKYASVILERLATLTQKQPRLISG